MVRERGEGSRDPCRRSAVRFPAVGWRGSKLVGGLKGGERVVVDRRIGTRNAGLTGLQQLWAVGHPVVLVYIPSLMMAGALGPRIQHLDRGMRQENYTSWYG